MDNDRLDDLEAEIIANRQDFLKRVMETITEAGEGPQTTSPPDEGTASTADAAGH